MDKYLVMSCCKDRKANDKRGYGRITYLSKETAVTNRQVGPIDRGLVKSERARITVSDGHSIDGRPSDKKRPAREASIQSRRFPIRLVQEILHMCILRRIYQLVPKLKFISVKYLRAGSGDVGGSFYPF